MSQKTSTQFFTEVLSKTDEGLLASLAWQIKSHEQIDWQKASSMICSPVERIMNKNDSTPKFSSRGMRNTTPFKEAVGWIQSHKDDVRCCFLPIKHHRDQLNPFKGDSSLFEIAERGIYDIALHFSRSALMDSLTHGFQKAAKVVNNPFGNNCLSWI